MLLCADADAASADLASGVLACPSCKTGRLRAWGYGRERAIRGRTRRAAPGAAPAGTVPVMRGDARPAPVMGGAPARGCRLSVQRLFEKVCDRFETRGIQILDSRDKEFLLGDLPAITIDRTTGATQAVPALAGTGRTPTVKNVGEPCAGEPHARFTRRGGAGNGASATAPVPHPTA